MENETVKIIGLCVLAFFLGAIPFGFIAGKLRGVDLRQEGSGNIGATNTLRVLGKGPGITVLILDVAKGWLPVFLASSVFHLPAAWVVGVGVAAVLGHTYSPWVRFKGGKGVATSLGVLIGLSPIVAGLSLLGFIVTVALSRYVSLGSIVASLLTAGLFWALPHPLPYQLFGTIAGLFVIVRHRGNIARLRAGTESRFAWNKSGSKSGHAETGGKTEK